MEAGALNVRLSDWEEARPFLELVELDGPETLAEMCQGAFFMGVEEGGEMVAAYALRISNRVLWILAAGGRAKADLAREIMPAIKAQAVAIGAQRVAVQTKRPGLVAKLLKMDFEVKGVILGCDL